MKSHQLNSLQSIQVKDLLSSHLKNKIETYINKFVPDNINFCCLLKSKAAKSQIQANACMSLDINTYGGFDKINKKTQRKKQQLIEDIQFCRQRILTVAQNILDQDIIDDVEFTVKRIDIIFKIIDIFLSQSHQVSEQAIAYFLKYAIAATDSSNQEQFYFCTSLGGDTVAPTMVEAYLIHPLDLLRELWQLLQQEDVYRLPRLAFVFTYVCQLAENDRDKERDLINPALHVYNSRQTLLRIADFIKFAYPNLASYCDYLIFPAYDRCSMTRLFCAVSWQKFPGDRDTLQKMFRIAGDVQDKNLTSKDLLHQIIGEFNAYVPRHGFSNLILSKAHTLRFGSDRTEPQFHLVASTLVQYWQKNPEQIKDAIRAASCLLRERLHTNIELIDRDRFCFEPALNFQFKSINSVGKIHAQIGIPVHAAYYKHPDEPYLNELVSAKTYTADVLRNRDRANKAEQLEAAFNSVVERLGKSVYIDFLAAWNSQYLDKTASEEELRAGLSLQSSIINSIVMEPHETRQLMNYWLL
ncbi:MAG: hypothetical protein QNJ55_22925 [Xenococcus sp. MO_188.B8]|nr:hypothetical protein [Xenococcus sp. MO_188.B8]